MSNGRPNTAVRDLRVLFDVGVMGTLTDGQLLDRFVARREGAVFEALLHRHGPMVWGVCHRVLRDHHDAEDAFQATFLVLARKAPTVLPREKVGNWLYGVAYQTAIRARATRTKRRMREGQVTDMPEPEAIAPDHQEELIEWLDRELSRLPEKYRIPVVLCELEGKTHREAAEQLGWPIGTVSGRLSRARSMLAKRLTRRGLSLSVGSLTILLAQESASASLPTKLIGSTAQAACLFAAGRVMSAWVVSAQVAALTREVLEMMLLGKLKIGVVMLLVGSAVAVGGTGLAYRARATEPNSQKEGRQRPEGLQRLDDLERIDSLQRVIDEKKEELQRLLDKVNTEQRGTNPTRSARKPEGGFSHTPLPVADGSGVMSGRGTTTGTPPPPAPDRPERQAAKPMEAQDPGPGDRLSDLIEADATPEQLRRAKEYIDAMLVVENARTKTPEQLDETIREKERELEHFRWAARVVEVQIRRLKKYRDAPRPDGGPERGRGLFRR